VAQTKAKTKAGADAGAQGESVLQWWVRYAVVPVLGGGGLFSLAAVLLTSMLAPNAPKAATAATATADAASAPPAAAASAGAAVQLAAAPAPVAAGALDDQARSAAARFLQALLSDDRAALVDMVDEPVHITGKVHLTRLGLRCALEAEHRQPLVPGMDRLAGRDVVVKRLAAADLGAFPGAREGDYQALIASGGAGARATDGLQLHLRQRGAGFVVLRIVQGSA